MGQLFEGTGKRSVCFYVRKQDRPADEYVHLELGKGLEKDSGKKRKKKKESFTEIPFWLQSSGSEEPGDRIFVP